MHYRVTISLGNGSLIDGFASVRVEIQCDTVSSPSQSIVERRMTAVKQEQRTVSLPPAIALRNSYRDWKVMYQALQNKLYHSDPQEKRSISVASGGITNISKGDFDQLCSQLKQEIDRWFDNEFFRGAKEMLLRNLDATDHIRLILETEDPLLWRMPWHQWGFFEQYPHAELSLTNLNAQRLNPQSSDRATTVQILAILGDSGGLNLEPDIQAIQALPQVSIEFLTQPSREELTQALWSRNWDILFFAGHSSSQTDRPQIALSPTASLTIPELNHALKQAIDRGLQLAIFNSCDGVGLAQNLADLNLPHGIVMRENVPDRIAQIFLKHFLKFFSSGRSLSESVRQTRLRLEGYQDQFPQASWLPALFEHPKASVLYWSDLLPTSKLAFKDSARCPLSFRQILIRMSLITAAILGVRYCGAMQSLELTIVDQMMRSRPVEKMDDRLLIVEITEEDLKWQTDRRLSRQGSLSDQALSEVLTQLSVYKPTTIGIDVYHDFPVDSSQKNLSNQLKIGQNIFMICRHNDPQAKFVGIAPVPNFPTQNLGFSDVVEDLDGVVRRHLFSLTPNLDSPCQTELSLSLQIASYYLSRQNINVELSRDSLSGDVKMGDRKIPLIQSHWGTYQGINDSGYQMMINYRSQPTARRITLRQVINKEFDPQWVQGKIILIGVTAPTAKDSLFTPYSTTRQVDQKMPGVLIQAQMTSQLVSGMLDRRPWIDVLPMWVEGGLVWGWCVGSWLIISRTRLIRSFVLIIILISLGLWSICWISLSFLGILMPFVPLESVMISTSLFCLADRYRLKSSPPVCLSSSLPPSSL